MTPSKERIDEFLCQPSFAVLGVSRSGTKYSNLIFRALKAAGREVYAVNPWAERLEGSPAYPSLSGLPVKPEVVVSVVPPAATEAALREAAGLGIRRMWIQPGAGSVEARRIAATEGIELVDGACVLVLLAR